MGPDDVDFTVMSSGDGTDEDLPQRERQPWGPLQRAAAGIVALAAVVGAGIAIARSQPSRPAATRPSATTSVPDIGGPGRLDRLPSTSVVTRFVPPPDVIVVDSNRGAIACPQAGDGQSACQSTHAVPEAVRSALEAHFPGARVVAETNQTLRDTGLGSGGLWYRRVVAVAGPIRITVMVRRPVPEDITTSATNTVRNRLVATESTGSGGFTVTVTVDAPQSHPSVFGSLDLLVSDTRLLVAG